ncbi:hypothetical protein M501DRAFT_1000020 [Patellaria atrata CBS 101060]|uniref:Uncharacterized protein n=1 Tax=Patellaria atrata CBS 101060 TaxID=1346257 RepID=A0A9P4S1W4_9PEZI|nr:hypothetical protein M501DRAFT_1000020 [Patellaria atrata CBS 101060]
MQIQPQLIPISCTAPTSFCKCTCFSNYTIIPLDPVPPSSRLLFLERADSKSRRTCNDCNRSFCLDYNLPSCKGAKEDDIFATCFQRDSMKDQIVVFIFIAATVTLLVYAAARPWIEQWTRAREQHSYLPIMAQEDQDVG